MIPEGPIIVAIGLCVLLVAGFILLVSRGALTRERELRVRPKLFIGYDEESAALWRRRFGYDRRLPDLARFYEAFDPSVLTLDEAEAETVIKLAYSWGSAEAYGRSGSSVRSATGVSLCCEITVSSTADRKVIMRRSFVGAPPSDSSIHGPSQCRDEVIGGMPEVGLMVALLKRLRVG